MVSVSDVLQIAGSVVAISVVSAVILYQWWLRHPKYGRNPGPVCYPIIGCVSEIKRNKERLFEWQESYIMKQPNRSTRMSGPWAEVIFTANPDCVEHIAKTKFDLYPKGQPVCEPLVDLVGETIFNVDGESWKEQRKVAGVEFSMDALRNSVFRTVNKETRQRVLPLFDHFARESKAFDLQEVCLRLEFDFFAKMAFDFDPAVCDPTFPGVDLYLAFQRSNQDGLHRFISPPFMWKFMRAFNIGSEGRLKIDMATINNFGDDVIEKRRQQIKEAALEGKAGEFNDLLSRFIKLSDKQGNADTAQVAKSNKYIRDMLIGFLVAGRDSSASTIARTFMSLSQNKKEIECIHQELKRIIAARPSNNTFSNREELMDLATSFTLNELKEMHCLHAALFETLRLFPPIPVTARTAAADDVWPDGTIIKKNTKISIHIHTLGRMKELWGEDALEYKPARFLENGVVKKVSPFQFAAFLGGPRGCIGKEMALTQMKFTSAAILMCFDVEAHLEGVNPIAPGLQSHPEPGLPVTVQWLH